MLIVDDHPNMLPPEVSALEEIHFVMSALNMPLLREMALGEEALCAKEGGSLEECDEDAWSDGPVSGEIGHFVVINGMYQPIIPMVGNRWYRWRMVLMTASGLIKPEVPGCDLLLLAKDGIYLHTAPREVQDTYLGPGNRVDLLVRCPPGDHDVTTREARRNLADASPNLLPLVPLLATIQATDEGEQPCSLPTFTVNRPVYAQQACLVSLSA